MTMFTRTIDLGLLTLMLLALGTAGCGGANGADGTATDAAAEDGTAGRSVRVETLVIQPDDFEDVIELTGTVESLNDAMLSAQSAGTVEYLAPLGRQVARGAVVARLDQGIVNASFQQAQARVEAAQAQLEWDDYNYTRQERLFQDSIISALEFQTAQTQLNRARASLREAEAMLSQAQEQVNNTVVRAPFGGTVEEHAVERGEQVTPGMPVLRVVDTRQVKVRIGVPERYAGDIEIGTRVAISFKAYRGDQREGRVSFAGSAINRSNRTFPIEVEIDNRDGRLKPEMIAQVYVTREVRDDVLVVPRAAVLRDEAGTSLFVVTPQNGVPTANRQAVTLGPAYGGQVIVERGLEPGAEIIVLGQTTVTDGDAVDIIEQYTRLDEAGVPVK